MTSKQFKPTRNVHNLVCGISGGFYSFFDKFLRARDVFRANEMKNIAEHVLSSRS